MLIKAKAVSARMEPRKEEIKPIKDKIKGLHYDKRGSVFLIEDLAKRLRHQFGGEGEEEEEENDEEEEEQNEEEDSEDEDDDGDDMEVHRDYVPRQREPEDSWSRVDQEAHNAQRRDAQRAQFWMQEYYRYQD